MKSKVSPPITRELIGIEYSLGHSRQKYLQRLKELQSYLEYVKDFNSEIGDDTNS